MTSSFTFAVTSFSIVRGVQRLHWQGMPNDSLHKDCFPGSCIIVKELIAEPLLICNQ